MLASGQFRVGLMKGWRHRIAIPRGDIHEMSGGWGLTRSRPGFNGERRSHLQCHVWADDVPDELLQLRPRKQEWAKYMLFIKVGPKETDMTGDSRTELRATGWMHIGGSATSPLDAGADVPATLDRLEFNDRHKCVSGGAVRMAADGSMQQDTARGVLERRKISSLAEFYNLAWRGELGACPSAYSCSNLSLAGGHVCRGCDARRHKQARLALHELRAPPCQGQRRPSHQLPLRSPTIKKHQFS